MGNYGTLDKDEIASDISGVYGAFLYLLNCARGSSVEAELEMIVEHLEVVNEEIQEYFYS